MTYEQNDVIPFEVKFSLVDSISFDEITSELMNETDEVKSHYVFAKPEDK